jgi:CDP-diacylglycerol--glycerol-3-phosphate 3-phosphatidyltransferase
VGAARLTWNGYARTWAGLHGGHDPRRLGRNARRWLRLAYRLGILCARLRIRPAAVTAVGLLMSLVVPFAVREGPAGAVLAGGLVLLTGLADTVDGAVAMVTGRTSRLGHVYDSLADRIAEAAWLAAFWLLGAPGALVVAIGGLAWLHEYLRSRAIGAGMLGVGRLTVGEYPVRVAMASAGLLLAGTAGRLEADLAAGTVTLVGAVWGLLAVFGFGRLLGSVRDALR